METKVRISYGTREIEVVGSEEFVREQLDNLSSTMEMFASNSSTQSDVQEGRDEDTSAEQGVPKASSKLPETFGEYLNEFPKDVSQEDQVLIAGYFAQCQSSENSFTTKEANELLKEQGVKASNASQSISNAKEAKKVFALQKGSFRISRSGVDHIKSLHTE